MVVLKTQLVHISKTGLIEEQGIFPMVGRIPSRGGWKGGPHSCGGGVWRPSSRRGGIYYIVGSVQSSHEKIALLTESIQKEKELRIDGIQKEKELRIESTNKEKELRVEGIQKEKELREKDAAILRAELSKEQEVSAARRAVLESELRAVKSELEWALKTIESKSIK